MDADQHSVTSSVVDPFGLQRRQRNFTPNTNSAKENQTNSDHQPENSMRNINNKYAGVSSSLHSRAVSTAQKTNASVDENTGRIPSRDNGSFVDEPSRQHLSWRSDKYAGKSNLNNDNTRRNYQTQPPQNNDNHGYSNRLRSTVSLQPAQQHRSWAEDTTTLHTVTEDYDDDGDDNGIYHTSVFSRSIEVEDDPIEKLPLRSNACRETMMPSHLAASPSRARKASSSSSPDRVNTPNRARNVASDYEATNINHTSGNTNYLYRPSASLDFGTTMSSKKGSSQFDYISANNSRLPASTRSRTNGAITNKSSNKDNSTKSSSSQNNLELLEVSYGSPAHTSVSQLSSSPLEKMSTETIKKQNSDSDHHQRQSKISSFTQEQTNPTVKTGTSLHRQPLTAKYIAQLQSQLEECQKELAYATNEKHESQARAAQLESELQEVKLERDEAIHYQHEEDVRRRASLEDKERQLSEWENSLHQESTEIQRLRDELNRRKTSMNGLEQTVIELETTHQEEQARLSAWQEELQMQQEDLQQERQQLISQRETTNHEQKLWNLEKSEQLADIQSQHRRLAGWEKRLFQNEKKLQEQQQLLQHHEAELQLQRQDLETDRTELHDSLNELDVKTSRTEAKLQLMEQAMDELVRQRQEEEQFVQAAIQRRKERLAASEREAQEWEVTKASIELEIQSSRQQLHILQKQIEGTEKELIAAQDRIQTMSADEQKKREEQSKATAEADQRLSAILSQLEVAQREKEKLENKLKEKTADLETIQSRINEEELRLKLEQERLQEEKMALEHQKSESLQLTEKVVQLAKQRLQAFSNELTTNQDDASHRLEKRMTQVEALQRNLDAVARAYEQKFLKLQQDHEYNQRLRQQLDDRLKASTDREEQIRQDNKWALDRLQHRLDMEVSDHKQQFKDTFDRIQQDHDKQVQILNEQLAATASERDRYRREIDSLRLEVEQIDEELISVRESFAQDTSRLQRDLSLTRERAEIAEDQLLAMQQEKSAEKKEIEKLKVKVDWLESQTSMFDKKKKEWEEEHSRLKAVEQDFQHRMDNLNERERYLQDEDERIERKRRNLEYGFRQLDRQKQKAALTRFFSKPMRCEQEEVSAAFSKWVRVAMFQVEEGNNVQYKEMMLQKIKTAQQERDEAQQLRNQLMKERDTLVERDRKMQRELNAQRAEFNKMSQQLQGKLQEQKQENEQLRNEVLQNGKYSTSSLSLETNASSAARALELQRKEEELLQMQRRLQEEEHQRIQEFEAANERIRELAERLSQKDKETSRKQNQLEAEKAEFQRKEKRLQKLVSELQEMNKVASQEQEGVAQTKNQLSPARNRLLFDDNDSTPNRLSQTHDDSWFLSPANKIIR